MSEYIVQKKIKCLDCAYAEQCSEYPCPNRHLHIDGYIYKEVDLESALIELLHINQHLVRQLSREVMLK